jgi:hypothetical protein
MIINAPSLLPLGFAEKKIAWGKQENAKCPLP